MSFSKRRLGRMSVGSSSAAVASMRVGLRFRLVSSPDCIEIVPGPEHPDLLKVVEVDLDRCIGCTLCVQYCPWETIAMYDYDEGVTIAPSLTIRSIVPGHQAAALQEV